MVAKDEKTQVPKRCKYCNAKFNDDLRDLLQENEGPVYCELCGSEVRFQPEERFPKHEKGNKKQQTRSKSTSKKKKTKQKRIKEPNTQNPITHIGFDPDFPLTFKENFMLVVSRMTYLAIKKLDNLEALKNSKHALTKELLDQLEHALEPVIWAKILVNFLGKLHNLTIDQFYDYLKQFQKKIGENEEYREHFIIYLRYIINNTFRIISEMWDTPEIPKFFRVIRKDLKEYGFDKYNNDIIRNTNNESESLFIINRHSFPSILRSKICIRIKSLLDLGLDLDNISEKINTEIMTKSNWMLTFSIENQSRITKAFNSREYKGYLSDYVHELADIVIFINNNPNYSLRKISLHFSIHPRIISEIACEIMTEEEYYRRYTGSSAHSKKNGALLKSLENLLDHKRDLIIDSEFVPTRENIVKEDPSYSNLDEHQFYNKIRSWLNRNTEFSGIREVINNHEGRESYYENLYNFLDSRKDDILSGKYVPNISNLISVNPIFGNNLTRNLVNLWINKNSDMKNLTELIRKFEPTVTMLGYSFKDQIKRIKKLVRKYLEKLPLDVPSNFFNIIITMYYDILDSIDSVNRNNAFDIFYESLTYLNNAIQTITKVGLRDEKHLSLILIYYSLFYLIYQKDDLTKEERNSTIKEISLDSFGRLFKVNIRRISPLIRSYLTKISKYSQIFRENQVVNLYRFNENVTYNNFDYNPDRIKLLKPLTIKRTINKVTSNIADNNFPTHLFKSDFPRASNFKFRGTNKNRLFTKEILDFFLEKNQNIYRIPKDHTFSKICFFVQNIYDRYNKTSLGIQGHNIITHQFINKFEINNGIIPIARELPVWKELDTIALTGHIDLLAYYSKNDTITFLILDFKPKGKSGILRSIPQLTIYGILFRDLFFNTAKDLKINFSNYKINIKSIGFNNRLAYVFDPFKMYSEILDFVDRYNQKGISILRNFEYFKNLITN